MSASAYKSTLTTLPEYIQAKPLDLSLRTQDEGLFAWIQSLSLQNINNIHQGSLFEVPDSQPAFQRALQMVVENVIKNYPAPFLSLSKSWSDYPPASRYNPDPLPLSSVIAATEFLRDLGWVVIHPGSKEQGLRTRLEPTESFIEALEKKDLLFTKITASSVSESIVLRDHERTLVDYTDTKKTTTIRRHLHVINAFLNKHSVMFSGRRLNTRLVRIFKDNFLQGGRFYRADHLGLKSEERRQILLNGESIVEVDYSCLHINMLYIKETGIAFQGDAYDVGSSSVPRDVFKIILQIILNCETKLSAVMAANEALRSRGLNVSAEKAIETFLRKHQAIAKYFFSGVGLGLQYEDSVIAENVLLKAVQANIPVLPIHDSFLAPASQEAWLLAAMKQASEEVLGAALPVKIKRASSAPMIAA